ncbi:hypothetical protein AD998_13435 [bacterium 336/3]|nr:hypothetical protein AD998_13435 [bacterium 336/3]
MMKNKNIQFPTVLPFSTKGKILVGILRILYFVIGLFFRKWRSPIADFEENPAFFKAKDILYLGYKYYIKPPYQYPSHIVEHFQNQNFDFILPNNFEIKSKISVSVGGDLMPYEWIQKPYTKHLWDEVGEFFFGTDIVFANLETPIDINKPASLVPEVMLSDMHFNGNEEMFEVFSGNGKYKGYDVLSTANNHSMDMGAEGVLETIKFLEQKNIAYTGTAKSPQERQNFPILERNGIKIAFIAYTYSLNQFLLSPQEAYLVNTERLNTPDVDLKQIKEDVLHAHIKGADLVMLSLHTGNAYQMYPSEHTVAIYHRIFEECGVDAILGSHPHNPQPMEKYVFTCPITRHQKQGVAIYSLADFVAYDIFVLDRLVPLLKLHIVKGITQEGNTHTQIEAIEVKPVYNWGKKNVLKGKEMRFLDLEILIQKIHANQTPEFMSKLCVKEALYLYEYWKKVFRR